MKLTEQDIILRLRTGRAIPYSDLREFAAALVGTEFSDPKPNVLPPDSNANCDHVWAEPTSTNGFPFKLCARCGVQFSQARGLY